MKDILGVTALLALLATSLALVKFWMNWRQRALTRAGAAFGFRRLQPGEKLPVVLVPLLERSSQHFVLILKGFLDGFETAFFDLYHSSGRNWDLQSTVLVKNPQVDLPKFQLRPRSFFQTSPKRCPYSVDLPEVRAAHLELTSRNPEWAQLLFSQASPQFLQKVRRGKWMIEGRCSTILVYRLGTRIAPRKLQKYVTEATELGAELFAFSRQSVFA
jgi:hypothetical protein